MKHNSKAEFVGILAFKLTNAVYFPNVFFNDAVTQISTMEAF